jgi:glycerophosphoryl diester phosphodiesterase
MRYLSFILFAALLFISCKQSPDQGASSDRSVAGKGGIEQLSSFFKYEEGKKRPMVSAHRGGKSYKGYPENCIETFEYVLGQTAAIIECDIELTKDSFLILMHDNTLDRTTTGSGPVQQQSWAEISQLRLVDPFREETNYRVPLLEDVLDWAKGKTILTLDIKRSVPYKMVTDLIREKEAEGYTAVITYNANQAERIHAFHPDLMISANLSSEEAIHRHLKKSAIPANRMIAFVGVREPKPEVYQKLHEEGISCILGTLGNLDKRAFNRGDDKIYPAFIENGADILATDRPIEAAKWIGKKELEAEAKSRFFSISPQ